MFRPIVIHHLCYFGQTLHSGNFDQLNDLRGLEGCGTHFFTAALRASVVFGMLGFDPPPCMGGGGGAPGGAGGGGAAGNNKAPDENDGVDVCR